MRMKKGCLARWKSKFRGSQNTGCLPYNMATHQNPCKDSCNKPEHLWIMSRYCCHVLFLQSTLLVILILHQHLLFKHNFIVLPQLNGAIFPSIKIKYRMKSNQNNHPLLINNFICACFSAERKTNLLESPGYGHRGVRTSTTLTVLINVHRQHSWMILSRLKA